MCVIWAKNVRTVGAKRNNRKDANRWDDFKDFPKVVTVQRNYTGNNYAGVSAMIDAPRERNKLYEQRDAWMGEYLFGKN